MKKILYIILSLSVLSACTESLNRFPLDKLSDADFFSTEEGLKIYSNTFYTVFPGPSNIDNACNVCLDHADNYFRNLRMQAISGSRQPESSGSGEWSWTALRRFNTLIENSAQCPDEKTRIQYVALARFFRAYFYFEKVKRFGDVPWYSTQLGSDSPELYKTQDSRELVMNNVIKDLDYAIENLPSTKSVYEVTKWTAFALKSRVCLFEGTFRKYHKLNLEHSGEWFLEQCVEASNEFIAESGYKLYSTEKPEQDYFDLFTADTYQGHPSTCEVILARNYNATYNVMHRLHALLLTSGESGTGMSRKTVATYLMRDGSRFTDKAGWQTMQFYEEMQNRDPRLAQSIRYPGYTRIGGTKKLAPDLQNNVSGYQPIKFLGKEDKDTHGQSDADVILFRSAEVLLNYAEAKAELGTVNQADLDMTVNVLRRRAGLSTPACQLLATTTDIDPFLVDPEWGGYRNVSDNGKKAVILEIRRERNVELNQEGFRYFDLMRWKEGQVLTAPMYGMYFPGPGEYDLDHDGTMDVYLYSGDKGSSTAPVTFKLNDEIYLSGQDGLSGMINKFKNDSQATWNEDRDYLYPLPLQELRLNTNLVQNPLWPVK